MAIKQVVTVTLFAVMATGSSVLADSKPLPEAPESTVGYATVAQALEGVSAKPGIKIEMTNGWLVATDMSTYSIWSFAPADYPAYPAVVKRQVVSLGENRSRIEMNVLCEASKTACDELVRTFARMNGLTVPQ